MRVVPILATSMLVAGLAACGGGGGPSDLNLASVPTTVSTTSPTTRGVAVGSPATATGSAATSTLPLDVVLVAQAHVPQLLVYAAPNAPRVTVALANPWLADPGDPSSQVAQVFLVETQRADGWVQVLLPVSPNGTTGWVHTADVTLTQVAYRIRVSLTARRMTVFDHNSVIYQGAVAVGAPATKTPAGRYYVRMLLKAPSAHSDYGPFAYGLSSRTGTISTFRGDDSEIGIHGNNDPAVLGRAVTRGSIRMADDELARLAALLPLGTPVDIGS